MLLETVSDVLLRIDTSITAQPEFTPKQSDRLFILLVSDYCMEVLLPHMLALASEQGCKVRFESKQRLSESARALEQGEADILIFLKTIVHPITHKKRFLKKILLAFYGRLIR
jgi:LysR family nod box-dependent transcriptional activator